MSHYVYIIYSKTFNVYYKGETSDYVARLEAHNTGLSRYTKGKGPWELIYLERFDNKTDAQKREKMLKRQHRPYLSWLIRQDINLLNQQTEHCSDPS